MFITTITSNMYPLQKMYNVSITLNKYLLQNIYLLFIAQTGATAGASPLVEKDVPPQMVDGQPHLPFQLQIEYTNSDGDRCLRVITKTKPVTQDRKLAEKGMLIYPALYIILILLTGH